MGQTSPDRRTPELWRAGYEQFGQMRKAGWAITSTCNRCHLSMRVDLDVMHFLIGDQGVLWNRHPHCRRIHCEGRVTFWAQPPECDFPFPLRAEWPYGLKR